MKKIYTILLIFGFSALMVAQEEPCPPNGITTNPEEPINDLHPGYENIFFDWTEEEYEVDFGNINIQGNPYTSNNAAVAHLYNTGDYQPEDGWELLYVDFGLDKQGNPYPSGVGSGQLIFILYNKYRSFIRVFVAIDELGQNNLVEIELSMEEGQYNTALLASIDKVQQPLKSFDPANVASNTQKYTIGTDVNVHWHYADFPVNYDPCTCEAPAENPIGTSKIHFEVNLIDEAKIELNGFSNGTAELKAEKQSASSTSSADWDDFYGTVKKAGNLIEAGKKGYKTFELFKDDADETATGKDKETEMMSGIDNLSSFLTDNIPFLKYVPYASEALAIIDFFTGGAKNSGPQAVTFPPLAIQLEHSFSGKIYSSYNYIGKPIYTPGSSFSPEEDDDLYPIYNEILGVYTLLEKPKVTMWKGYAKQFQKHYQPDEYYVDDSERWYPSEKNIVRRAFQVDGSSVKIAVNKASDLTLKEAYVQLVYKRNGTATWKNSASGTVVNDTVWVSSLVPLACIDEQLIISDIVQNDLNWPNGDWQTIGDHGVDISLVLAFENTAGDHFLHKATWKCDLEETDYNYEADRIVNTYAPDPWNSWGEEDSIIISKKLIYNWFDHPEFENKEGGFYDSPTSINFNNAVFGRDTSASEMIVIENSTIEATAQPPLNNGYTNLIAGQSIEILPTSEILPNSDLRVSPLGRDCNAPITLATASQIASICEGNDYQGQKILAKKFAESSPSIQQEQFSFLSFPNPADDYMKISLSDNVTGVDEIEVTIQDMTGRIVLLKNKLAKVDGVFEVETASLTSGVYLMTLRSGSYRAVRKIIIR